MKRNYDDPDYKKFRTSVLKRDGFKCQMPNCYNTQSLNVHHIQKWSRASSLRYEPSNGITLCKYCHKSITGKEIHYEVLFREIISGKI
jgi:5-methylcytosine-specific restriction endonuclease McrA